MRSRGFTLTEVMLATGIFSLLMLGSLGVYQACTRTWRATETSMEAARRADLAIQHMVIGVHGFNGLRGAVSTNVQATSVTGTWSITYSDGIGGRYRFAYDKSRQEIVFSDLLNSNLPAQRIGTRIVASSIVPAATTGVSVSVSAAASCWQNCATSTVTTYVYYRN
jgi:prepilin-type N-terminal cleavage/methylation domain-containing protein